MIAATAVWIRRDTVPPLWDSAHYLQHSEILFHALTREGFFPFLAAFSHAMDQKAPLIAALPIPFYFLIGESHTAARCTNLVWIAVASLYLFRIGRIVSGSAAGLLAVVVLNTLPLAAGMSRQYLVEYGLMTIVIVWTYYLIRWQEGGAEAVPWILGALLGFGLLLKVSLPLYVAVPTGLVLARRFSRRPSLRSLFLDLARIIAVALPIAAIWYGRNLVEVSRFVVSAGFGELGRPYGTGPVFSLGAIGTYWLDLVNHGVSAFYSVLLLLTIALGCVSAWRSESLRRRLADSRALHLILLWWLVPALALTLLTNKDPRYAAPWLPALALLLAAGISELSGSRHRVAVCLSVAALGLLNFFYYSFGAPWTIPERRLGPVLFLSDNLGWAHPPISEPWPDEKVLELVAEDARRSGNGAARVRVLFSHPRLNAHVLNYLAVLHDSTPRFWTVQFQTPEPLAEVIAEINSRFDYLLTKSGSPGAPMVNVRNLEVVSALERGALRFEPFTTLALPDGSSVTILRRVAS